LCFFFFFQAEDGIRDGHVTGVQTCALPIWAVVLAAGHGGVGRGAQDGQRAHRRVLAEQPRVEERGDRGRVAGQLGGGQAGVGGRSEEHTSELQSRGHLVCRLLLEKKKQKKL